MKNACKRLFSLMLALVLLVSVVPFQASAAGEYTVELSFDYYDDIEEPKVKKEQGNVFENVAGDRILKNIGDKNFVSDDGYEFQGWFYWDGSAEYAIDENTTVEAAAVEGKVDMYAKLVKTVEPEKTYTVNLSFDYYEGDTKVKDENGGSYTVNAEDGLAGIGNAHKAIDDGYEFQGWFYWDGAEHNVSDSTTVAEAAGEGYEVDLYAKVVKTVEEEEEETTYTVKTSVDTYDGENHKGKSLINMFQNVKGSASLSDYAKDCGGDHDKYNCKWFYWDGSNEHSISNTTVAEAAVDGEVDLYAKHALKEDTNEDGNVFVKFMYDGNQKGDTFVDEVKRPWDYNISKRDAQRMMDKVGVDTDKYELKLDRDGNPYVEDHRNSNGSYTYYVKLIQKNSKSTVYVTVKADGYKDALAYKEPITVYDGETLKDDGYDWVRRALTERKYNEIRHDYHIDYDDCKSYKDNGKRYIEIDLDRNHKNDYEIYLQVYMNGDKSSYAKKLTITDSRYVTDDGRLDMEEARKLVREYFEPKDTKKDMNFDGLWLQGTDKVFDYDQEHESVSLKKYRDGKESVNVVIMANNAKLKKTSSNPKTGDEILMTVTVMAVSAIALAGAYVLNKKRMAK